MANFRMLPSDRQKAFATYLTGEYGRDLAHRYLNVVTDPEPKASVRARYIPAEKVKLGQKLISQRRQIGTVIDIRPDGGKIAIERLLPTGKSSTSKYSPAARVRVAPEEAA
jgi:hypothetical protein